LRADFWIASSIASMTIDLSIIFSARPRWQSPAARRGWRKSHWPWLVFLFLKKCVVRAFEIFLINAGSVDRPGGGDQLVGQDKLGIGDEPNGTA
jgi:hypothetical protein